MWADPELVCDTEQARVLGPEEHRCGEVQKEHQCGELQKSNECISFEGPGRYHSAVRSLDLYSKMSLVESNTCCI